MRLSLLATTFLAAPVLLAGCTRADTAAPEAAAPAAAAEPAPAAPEPAPKPQIGAYGFDEAGMDKSIAPGDDFYGYANGTWAKTTPIPADRSNYGMFTVLDDLSKQRTREILDGVKDDAGSKIGVAYSTYLDQAAIDAKGLAPIQPWLNQIKAVNGKVGFPLLYAMAARNGVPVPFASYIGQDDKAPEVYALNLYQAGLGMPDRDYYLSTDAKLAETKAAYEKHLANVLTLAGEANAAARAKAIVAFETKIAKAHWTRVESRDATKTYNKLSLADLARQAPGFDFKAYFVSLGAPVDSAIVAQPSAVAGIARLIQATPIAVLPRAVIFIPARRGARACSTFEGAPPTTSTSTAAGSDWTT